MRQENGLRYNGGKRQWSLVDFQSLEPMVQVLEYGMHKYSIYRDIDGKEYKGRDIPFSLVEGKGLQLVMSGRDNWRKGLYVTKCIESLLRHVFALLRGELNDVESGLPHIGHILCNALFISYMLQNKPEFNDLPKLEEDKK